MNLDNLPWENIEDKDAVHLAKKYLHGDPIIFEAGVCDAEDTLRFKQVWPNCTIYGFEPVPHLYAKSAVATGGMEGIWILEYALARNCGNREFFESEAMPASSSFFVDNLENIRVPGDIVEEMDKDGRSYRDFVINVECVSIDHFCKRNGIGSIDYIWLDTEGYELEILKGAEAMLPTVKVISIELNFQEFRVGSPLFEEVYNFMMDKGFELKHIWQARPDWQANGIFVRTR